ncbi:MAG TPA: MFS transporter [Stellaceae bacterium]|nr:MFS transporter [Stellaceae bacterium]
MTATITNSEGAGGGYTLPKGLLGIVTIVVMVCGPAMVGMMLTICLPILPNMVKAVGGDKAALIAMPTAGIVVGGILAGLLLSRVSAKTLMIWSIALFGVVGVLGMVLEGAPLLVSRFLTGVVATCVSAASTTLIGEHIPAAIRPRVLGMQMAGSSLIGIVAMNISGALNDSFGWQASFALFPIIAIILLIPGIPLIPPSAKVQPSVERTTRSGWRLILDMWPVYLFLLIMNATVYTSNSQTPFILSDQGVTSAATRAHLQSINQTLIVLSAFAYPLTRRFLGSRWIPAFFLTMAGIGLVLLGSSHSLLQVGVALAFTGVGSGTLFPHQSNLILSRAAPEIRGRAVGLMVSNQFLADTINPYVYPPLAMAVGGLGNSIIAVGLACGVGMLFALGYGARTSNVPLTAEAKGYGH